MGIVCATVLPANRVVPAVCVYVLGKAIEKARLKMCVTAVGASMLLELLTVKSPLTVMALDNRMAAPPLTMMLLKVDALGIC